VNKGHQNGQGFSLNEFTKALSDAVRSDGFHGPLLGMSGPEYEQWIEPFLKKAKPCLMDLYIKYEIPPGDVIETVMLSRFAPVPATFPKVLRNARRRERLATQYERLAKVTSELDGLNSPVWGYKLVHDHLELYLKNAAESIRRLKSVSGRPEDRMLKECARSFLGLFRDYKSDKLSVASQRSYIDVLLGAAFPDRWVTHGDGARAVGDLLR
jgi:hypothetical protein